MNQQVNDLRRTWACEEVALGHLRRPICNPYQLLRTVVLSVVIGVCPASYQAVHRVLPLSWSSFQPVPAARLSCLSSYFVGTALPVSLHASKSMIAVCFPSCSLRAPFFFFTSMSGPVGCVALHDALRFCVLTPCDSLRGLPSSKKKKKRNVQELYNSNW